MVKNRVGSVVVIDGSKPIEMITERDIMMKVSVENKREQEAPAREIMSSPLVAIKAFDSIDTAAEAMVKHKVKRLVVLEDDGLMAGVLSISDIAKKLAKILANDYDRYRTQSELDLQ